jgi:SAM-dependent methyltransferase
MFVSVIPGMAALVSKDAERLPGVRVTHKGFDGRSDLLLLDVTKGGQDALRQLPTIEDLFVEVGRTMRSSGDKPQWIASRIWRPERTEKALSVWSAYQGPLAGVMTYRVIARVLQESSFLRTELRRALTHVIVSDRPRWKVADPARIEIWISEYRPGYFVAGLRLSGRAMRQHEGREVERHGALRPTVAAMMVRLAGEPSRLLLDPCSGSGTILSEALAAGWQTVHGRDIDSTAVQIAKRNAPEATVSQGDVRKIDMPTATVDAVVSNLPFGQQYELEGVKFRAALAEMARVTRPGGRVIVLVPYISNDAIPDSLQLSQRIPIRILGMKTIVWAYDRV